MATEKTIQTKKPENKFLAWLKNYSFSILAMVILLVIWEGATRIFDIKEYILPAPSVILAEMSGKLDTLFYYSLVTGYEILLGYLLSIIVGIPLGLAIYYSGVLERIIYPFLVASQTIPKIAIAPLLVLWFGWGIMPKVIISFLIAFFPIVVDTVVGLKTTEPEMIYLVRSMGATRMQVFWKVSLPNALPNIFGALKVASTLAVVGAVVGEFVASEEGLGYLLVVSHGYLDTALMFAGIFFLSLLGIVFFFIIEILERVFVPWKVEKEGILRSATM